MAIDMHAHYLPPPLADMLRVRKFLPRIETISEGKELFHRPFGTTDFDPAHYCVATIRRCPGESRVVRVARESRLSA